MTMMVSQVVIAELFARADNPEVLEYILTSSKANVNQCWKDDSSLLMIAALGGYVESVKKLIRLGVDVNARSKNGITALMEAARNNHVEVIKILLANGAIITAANQHGHLAYHIAYYRQNHEAAELLKKELMFGFQAPANAHINNTKPIVSSVPITHIVPAVSHTVPKPIPDPAASTFAYAHASEYLLDCEAAVQSALLFKIHDATSPTWLHHLLAMQGTPADLIALCEDKLVRQEGFGCARTFAFTPATQFNQAYLQGLGITGLGVQHVLLQLHKACVKGVAKYTTNSPYKAAFVPVPASMKVM